MKIIYSNLWCIEQCIGANNAQGGRLRWSCIYKHDCRRLLEFFFKIANGPISIALHKIFIDWLCFIFIALHIRF